MSCGVRRARSAVLATVLGFATLSACGSGDGPGNGDAVRDCGYSVSWNDKLYLGLIYVLHKGQTEDDVVAPEPGRRIGRGFVPQCPGDSAGSPATVYAVPGVSADVAVMANSDDGGEPPTLCIRKGRALPPQLLRR
jgi:hypothetical protein